MSSLLGIALGILIGVISGVVMLSLLRMIIVKSHKQILSVIGETLAIPTFWFGGPWLATVFLKTVNLSDILESYTLSLTITFVLICIFPLIRYIIKTGNEIAEQDGGSDV